MKSVRLWFEKTGLAKYISHLDLNRCMTRAVRRAEIPLWYTEGFNPRAYMNFLMPLPLGQDGRREPLDIKIESEMENSEIMSRLNAVLPQGIRITEVCEPVCGASEIAAARYEVQAVFESEQQAESFCEKTAAIIEGGTLNAEKKSKKGIVTVNLCALTRSFTAEPDGKTVNIIAVLAAGNTVNLNCDLLMNTLYDVTELKPLEICCSRTDLLKENGEKFS